MSASLNKVQLIGNIGKDPEIRQTNTSDEVASFSLATTEFWKDKITNEQRSRTEWHKVVIFNERLIQIVKKYLHKGSQIYLEGQIQTRDWQDKDGNTRYTTEIVLQKFRGELMMMGSKSENSEIDPKISQNHIKDYNVEFDKKINELDDEIPF